MTNDEIVLRYMLWGFDETPYRVLGNKMASTRKPSACAICQQDIATGSRVRAQTEVYDGVVKTFRLCPTCCEAVIADYRDGDCLRMEVRTQIGMGMSGDAVDPCVSTNATTPDEWLPSEALYAFAGWLTSRDQRIVMSATDDAGPAADAVAEFCKSNQLSEPREGWHRVIVYPAEPVSLNMADKPESDIIHDVARLHGERDALLEALMELRACIQAVRSALQPAYPMTLGEWVRDIDAAIERASR